MLRMPPAVFDLILKHIGHKIIRKKTKFRKPISPEEKFSVTLKYMATGELSRILSQSYHLGKTSVLRMIHQTCLAIVEVLGPIFLLVSKV